MGSSRMPLYTIIGSVHQHLPPAERELSITLSCIVHKLRFQSKNDSNATTMRYVNKQQCLIESTRKRLC